MNLDKLRRRWLAQTAALLSGPTWARAPTPATSTARDPAAAGLVPLAAPAPLARMQAGADGSLLGLTRAGELWQARADGWQRLGAGLDPATPLATGHGRVVGRAADGGLWVHEAGRVTVSGKAVLAPQAGLLVLAFGIVGVTRRGDVHHVVRFDPGAAGWAESARSAMAVLPDARPLQFDPDGSTSDDNGHVAVFAGPGTRYPHGVLGDAVEPTTLLLLERHGLEPMLRLELPPPHVFEDIAPRAIAWRGHRALLTVRSGPLGAQLAVVARAAGRGSFELAALGEPIGQQNRWLSPSTDGQRLLAVHTPHIGGVLHTYTAQGDRLAGREVARDLSNHAIGQRELDVSAWVGSRWVVPAQGRRSLHVFDLGSTAADRPPQTVALRGSAQALQAWRRGTTSGVAALLDDGSAWWLPVPA